MLLFQFNKRNKLILHPEALKLCKHLKLVNNDQLRYIVLVYDYKSKFRLFPITDRKRMATREVYGANAPEGLEQDPLFIGAVEEYKTLSFDLNRDMRDKYMEKVRSLMELQMTETDPGKIIKYENAITPLKLQVDHYQKLIDTDEEREINRAGGETSEIEMWQERMKGKKKNRTKKETFTAQKHDIINFEEDEEDDDLDDN